MACPNLMKTNTPAIEEASIFFWRIFQSAVWYHHK
jgi:hypothetical protein